MRPSTRSRPLAVALTAAALAVGALTSCSSPPETWSARTVDGLEIPEIHWPHGAPDTSNPWVRALVDGLVAEAAARNDHDLSPAGPRQYLTDDLIEAIARRAWGSTYSSDERPTRRYKVYPGPDPLRVDQVSVKDPDHAAVTVCALSWLTNERDPVTLESFGQQSHGTAVRYQLVRGTDGRIRLDGSDFADSPCPLGSARPGFFRPAPDFGSTVKGADLIMPDGTPAE